MRLLAGRSPWRVQCVRAIAPMLLGATVAAQTTPVNPPGARVDTARRRITVGDSANTYATLKGFRLVDTDQGDVNLKLYTYARYLNQLGLDDTYTDAFGFGRAIDKRQDIQLQKVNIQFLGWVMDPKFRYLAYVWTSNVNQGLGAQVVVGGNLNYVFDRAFAVGAGVNALPGVRATEGNFPVWLTVDNRLIADEFFRPSYTMGIWAKGSVERLDYQIMLGNNLSQLGVDAGQMDRSLSTFATALVLMPTTGEFGTMGGFGDFDDHQRLATRIGAHYTQSPENFQGQADTEQFENVQIRLSDGSIIFTPDLFGPGIRVTDALYRMSSADIGLKYRGFSLEAEHYWRRVDDFEGPGTDTLDGLWDHGFQAQASAMVIAKRLQLYASHSKVFGEFGDPWDARFGLNWYPFRTQVVRWNAEYLRLRRSPVGGLALPYAVGGRGYVLYTSFELNF